MAYVTVEQIKSMFRDIDIEETSTAIKTSEVEQFIIDAEVEVNSKLSPYYVTPITGTESLKIVHVISKYLVVDVIKTILEMKGEWSDKEQEVQANYYKKANKLLNDCLPTKKDGRWIDPVMPLPDANTKSYAPKGSSVSSYNTELTATFTKGGNNW